MAQSTLGGLVWAFDDTSCSSTFTNPNDMVGTSVVVPLNECYTVPNSIKPFPFYGFRAAWNMTPADTLNCTLNIYSFPYCSISHTNPTSPYVVDNLTTTQSPCIAYDKDLYNDTTLGFAAVMFTCVDEVPAPPATNATN